MDGSAIRSLSFRQRWAASLTLVLLSLLVLLLAPGVARDRLLPPVQPGHGLDVQVAPDGARRLLGSFNVVAPGRYQVGITGPGRLFLDGRIRLDARSGGGPHMAGTWLSPGRHLLEVELPPNNPGAEIVWQRPFSSPEPMPGSRLSPMERTISREQAEAQGETTRQALTPLALALVWLNFLVMSLIWIEDRALFRRLALTSLFMALTIWFSSGSMAVYALGAGRPMIHYPCHYLVNPDHSKFAAALYMLDGEPRELWASSVVLRRILYPLLAYAPMKALGFMGGGLVATLALHLAALLSWGLWLRHRLGPVAANWGLWLLALYPGIYYWAGLPYSYAMIVPCSLWCYMILERLGRETSPRGLALWSAGLGVLFLGYDLIFFYAPAATLLVWWNSRSLKKAALTWPGLLIPSLVCLTMLRALGAYSADPSHEPLAVVKSYLTWPDFEAWGQALLKAPLDLGDTFFSSNFLILPALFLILWLGRRSFHIKLERAEICLLLAAILVWAVINLAPPFAQWHRGAHNSARFYQPVFVAFLLFCLRLLAAAGEKKVLWPRLATGAAMLLSAMVCLGTLLPNPVAETSYWSFYRQHLRGALAARLEEHGRRPLGICPPDKVIPPPNFRPQAPKPR